MRRLRHARVCSGGRAPGRPRRRPSASSASRRSRRGPRRDTRGCAASALPLASISSTSTMSGWRSLSWCRTETRPSSLPATLSSAALRSDSRIVSTMNELSATIRTVFTNGAPRRAPSRRLAELFPALEGHGMAALPRVGVAWPLPSSRGKEIVAAAAWREWRSPVRSHGRVGPSWGGAAAGARVLDAVDEARERGAAASRGTRPAASDPLPLASSSGGSSASSARISSAGAFSSSGRSSDATLTAMAAVPMRSSAAPAPARTRCSGSRVAHEERLGCRRVAQLPERHAALHSHLAIAMPECGHQRLERARVLDPAEHRRGALGRQRRPQLDHQGVHALGGQQLEQVLRSLGHVLARVAESARSGARPPRGLRPAPSASSSSRSERGVHLAHRALVLPVHDRLDAACGCCPACWSSSSARKAVARACPSSSRR